MGRSRGTAVVVGAVATLVVATAQLLAGGVAQARVVHLHGRGYGVTPSPAALRTGRPLFHERVQPGTFGGAQLPVEYHGGPLMLTSKLYLIFWGPEGSFPPSYTAPIIQYAKDLEVDHALTTDEFSVATQYANTKQEHITGEITLGEEADFVTTPYPARGEEGCTAGDQDCVSDAEIQQEILAQIKAKQSKGWSTDPVQEPTAQYLIYTPPGVSDCYKERTSQSECSNVSFCGYHAEIEEKSGPEERVAVYIDLPYAPECDSGQAPAGVAGNKDADGTLDSEIHELVESATDPEPESGYTDTAGEEVADKCAEFTEPQEIYGAPLGGSITEDTAFNQLIGGHSYYTQEIWSQQSTQTPVPLAPNEPAGCVARIGPTPSFTVPGAGETGQAIDFDGSGSYDISAPITEYEWNFGDGSPADTSASPTATHAYATAGTYHVSLTVTDASGAADASTQVLPITITESVGSGGGGSGPGGGSGSGSSTSPPAAPTPSASNTGTSPSTQGAKAATRPTVAQRLASALKACRKLGRHRRASCIAAAKRRFGTKKHRHKTKTAKRGT